MSDKALSPKWKVGIFVNGYLIIAVGGACRCSKRIPPVLKLLGVIFIKICFNLSLVSRSYYSGGLAHSKVRNHYNIIV